MYVIENIFLNVNNRKRFIIVLINMFSKLLMNYTGVIIISYLI